MMKKENHTAAKQVDQELARLWPKRGYTRGFPEWEKRIAIAAIYELLEAGEESATLKVVIELHEERLRFDRHSPFTDIVMMGGKR